MKNTLLFALLCLQTTLPAQWKAYVPDLPDTVGTYDLRIASGNDQVAWSVAMKYTVSTNGYAWVPLPELMFTKTADGGNTWTGGTIPLGTEPSANNVSPLSDSVAWECHVDYGPVFGNFVQRTTDGGKTWARFLEDGFVETNSYVNFVHFWDAQRGIAVGDAATGPGNPVRFFEIYLTHDGGQNWSRVPADSIPARLPAEFGESATYQVVGNTIWFSTYENVNSTNIRLFRSTNGGQSWEAFDVQGMRRFSFSDPQNGVYMERVNSVLQLRRTTDGGKTWTVIAGSPGNEGLVALALIPQSQVILAVQRTDILAPTIFTRVSKDGGLTWLDIGTGNENVNYVQFTGPATGYAGEWQPTDHPTRMYKYAGSPLTGLFSGKKLAAKLTLSPNPATDLLRVAIEGAEPSDFVLLLHDMEGRLLARKTLEKTARGAAEFDLTGLPSGVYSLTVSGTAGFLSRNFVKN